MSVGTVSDYTVRPIVWESLTNLSCWVGWLWELYEGREVVWGGGLCAGRFTVIELSLSSDPGRLKHQFSICVKLSCLSLREMGRGKVRGEKGYHSPDFLPLLAGSSLLLSLVLHRINAARTFVAQLLSGAAQLGSHQWLPIIFIQNEKPLRR